MLDSSFLAAGAGMNLNTSNTRRDWITVVGAAAGAAVSLYQWVALYTLRTSGETPGCAVNETLNCADVWNSALSIQIQTLTGLAFPAWGLAWSIAVLALVLPRTIYPSGAHGNRTVALRLLSTTAAVACIALLGYSLSIGVFCLTCILFYVCVAVVTFFAWRRSDPSKKDFLMAILHSAGTLAIAIILLVYPSTQIPLPVSQLSLTAAQQPKATGSITATDPLSSLFATLSPEVKQILSDALNEYRNAKPVPRNVDTGRVSFGDPTSPLHIVEWVDLMCPHCRNLHGAFEEFKTLAPSGWHLESRFYPLDGTCNKDIERRTEDSARCVGAKILICLGDTNRADENKLRTAFFDNQADFTTAKAWQLAGTYSGDVNKLRQCVDDERTQKTLDEDIAYADSHNIEGTPLVVINNRAAPALPALIYTLILTSGKTDHPALRTLPPPRTRNP